MTPSACELPSYGEATAAVDGWAVIAPYVPVSAYTSLCLVSSRLYGHFAARLWNDPLRAVQLLGLHRDDELHWYLHRFIGRSVSVSRASTRALVLTLDFRDFGRATADFLSDEVVHAFNDTLRQCQTLFPALRCLLLDSHPVFDPGALAWSFSSGEQEGQGQQRPLLLSVVGRSPELQATYLASDYMKSLVYLDISYLPGSLRAALSRRAIGPATLPGLRVLKVRGRELDDDTAVLLGTRFMRQLWSLDMGNNRLTEHGLLGLLSCCLLPRSFQSDARFSVEGKVDVTHNTILNEYGPYAVIIESDHSAVHNHPDRHFADTPAYQRRDDEPATTQRPDGTASVLGDGPDDLIHALSRGPGGDSIGAPVANVLASRPCQGFLGLSHLTVDGNRISLNGLQKAIRRSYGAFEHLDCEMLMMRPPPASLLGKCLSPSTRICGFIGGSHLLRPVVSSCLRSLRIHHSLVTQVPTVLSLEQTMPSLADIWVAEELLLPGVELADTPTGAFAPDMNPRLTSLTLTNLPRRSTGRLIRKLTRFMELAYEQERTILDTAAALPTSRRSPTLLVGLRCLRLEFEPDLVYEAGYLYRGDNPAFAGHVEGLLLGAPPVEFSFFRDWSPEAMASTPPRPQGGYQGLGDSGTSVTTAGTARESPLAANGQRLPGLAQGDVLVDPDGSGEYVTRSVIWNEFREQEVHVWIGPGAAVTSPHAAVNEYVRMLREFPSLRVGYVGIGPATPSQVTAGVPPGVYIFQWAWEAMIWRDVRGGRSPGRQDLRRMYDVVAELKRFRHLSRTAGIYWTGKLEVVTKTKAASFESW
ncbi:hypothetical protein RB595_004435 [Gaeumannomyces hyphopodioides]